MKLETKIAPHDFVIVIRPHLTKNKRWNGEVSVLDRYVHLYL